MSIEALLSEMRGRHDSPHQQDASLVDQVKAAMNAVAAMDRPRNFAVGDFVRQKAECRAMRFPTDETPCIVLRIEPRESVPLRVGHDDPHSSDSNAGRQENILIAEMGDSFSSWWVDERFLERRDEACRLRDEHNELLSTPET